VIWEQETDLSAAKKAGVDIFHYPYFAALMLPHANYSTLGDFIPFRLSPYLKGFIATTEVGDTH